MLYIALSTIQNTTISPMDRVKNNLFPIINTEISHIAWYEKLRMKERKE